MKNKKYLISAMALFLMITMVACSAKPAENKKETAKTEEKKEEKKEEVKMETASAEEKEATVKALEEQKGLELAVTTNTDSDKKSIEEKYSKLISMVKEDKMSKAEVLKLKGSTENYIKNVKEAQGQK